MISKTDLKNLYEWAKDKDFPIRNTSVYPQSIYKKSSSGYYKKSYGTDKIHSYSNKEIYSFPLKFGRKKPIIRESLIPSNIINILKNEEILYTVVSIFQSETFLKPHRDPHIYQFPYKRIQIPLEIPDKNKCYMEWIDIKGGPNKYYEYSDKEIDYTFNKIKAIFTRDKYKLIIVPSYRTPEHVKKKAFNAFSHDHIVIKDIDKKAYLSALHLSDFIVVTCDSTSMISEAAITGKPIYVTQMIAKKNNLRFKNFFSKFKELNIIKDLTDKVDIWSYEKLDEVNRISPIIYEKIKKNGIV